MTYIITVETENDNAYEIIENILTDGIDNAGLDATFYLEEAPE